ncbi:MAG: class C beta-lactamase-related serine hydrolase [Chloroflexota bacterium]|nr:MAG: class C beta-lactamase-related serine hydrolase [Chloroflexota bacterium]
MGKIKPLNLIFTFWILAVLTNRCSKTPALAWPEVPTPAYWPTNGWQRTTPEQLGMDSEKLVEMFAAIQEQGLNLHSLLIVRNGYRVLEVHYHPYGPGDVHAVASNTKTVVSTLVGIAIDQGKIESVDQKMLVFFPEREVEQLDPRKEAVSLRNLLSMTPGLDCEDLTPAAQGMYNASDWVQYLLDLPMNADPGKQWVYCSGSAHLLSAIVQAATGVDARTYANHYLFQPLGIPEVTQAGWAPDAVGVTNGIAGLFLTPRDLAKLGFLYLHQGQWDGTQVVSRDWMAAATREQAYIGPDSYVGGLDRRFGYMFSIFPEQNMYGYLGMAGQELFVVPEQNLVVVFTGALEVGTEASLLALVNEYIVPAVQSQGALPANPAAQGELEAVAQAAAGETRPVPVLPQVGQDISGLTYKLNENSTGWQEIGFLFEPGSDEAILRMSNSPDLLIGLDNRYRLTESPASRPVGLRGRWQADGKFFMEYILFGDFIHSQAWFEFDGDRMSLTLKYLNFPGQPMILQGTRLP